MFGEMDDAIGLRIRVLKILYGMILHCSNFPLKQWFLKMKKWVISFSTEDHSRISIIFENIFISGVFEILKKTSPPEIDRIPQNKCDD
jgi:hypothetical protein